MAQCRLTPHEFIKDSFTPHIGVLNSNGAEEICKKNNLTFIELLQPFCKLNSDVQYKDPNGSVIIIKNLKLTLVDVNTKPPQPALARKFLNSSVSDSILPRTLAHTVGDYTIDIPCSIPWFEAWRETFLQVQYPADHEFTKYFLSCMMVVAMSENKPLESLQKLSQTLNNLQNVSVTKLPKWFTSNTLRYYVLLYENNDTESKNANEVFEAMKQSYGNLNCFLLKINSRTSNVPGEQLPDPWSQFINKSIKSFEASKISPEGSPSWNRSLMSQSLEVAQEVNESGNTLPYHPLSPENENTSLNDNIEVREKTSDAPILHGSCLSTEDVEQIKLLIHDFATRALMPFIEKLIHQLSDLIANKKGVSKSLFSATKRWFTPNKPTSNSATINTLTYPPDAPELHIRKLGDLYFMFAHYSMAFQAYHSAKRDFMADQAWLYYAGALEMAALSAYMGNESSRKTFDYMEEGITTYLNTCKMAQFATRATLLSSECLKGNSLYGEAAHQLIRMTSEESDLRSALLLEQAAYCFLFCAKPNMVRKYAFHLVLAGHRFNKSAQKKHSLRCYKQAYQIYQNKGWNLADDHIHYTIGRQANTLHELEEAVQTYAKLLTEDSKQTSQQQAVFLKEYLTTHNTLLKQQNDLHTPVLPLPLVLNETIKVLVGPAAPLRTPGKVAAMGINLSNKEDLKATQKWNKLEEMLVQEAQGSLPMFFKPAVTLFTNDTSSSSNPIAVIGEPIQVAVDLYNPLQILLNLKDIYLLWQFKDDTDKFAANEIMSDNFDHIIKTHYIKSVVIQANSSQEVLLTMTPLTIGNLTIEGICFSIISNHSETEITLRGKQIFKIKDKEKGNANTKPNKRLQLSIVPSAPCLQVSFSELNSELLRNELQEISVELRNVGSVPLHKIYMATSVPHLLSSCEFKKEKEDFSEFNNFENVAAREKEARKNHVSYLPLPNDVLSPGQYYNTLIWMKAPEIIGPTLIDLLIYYENMDTTGIPRYRTIRHVWQLSIQESVKVKVVAQQSYNSKKDKQLALVVKGTNLNKTHYAILTEITLIKAALLSPNWILKQEIVAPKNLKLLSQESAYIFLKLVRKRSSDANYSEVLYNTLDTKVTQSNMAYLDFAQRNEQNRINIFDDIEWSERPNKKHDATLILRWQAFVTDSFSQSRVVYGQNQIPINIVLSNNSQSNNDFLANTPNYSFDRMFLDDKTIPQVKESRKEDKHIFYNLIHSPMIKHNFQKSRLCTVPVTLLLHSMSESSLVVTVNTLGATRDIPISSVPSLFYPYSSSNFRWSKMGNLIRTIEPFSSTSLELSVVVLCSGTYDLGTHLEVSCHKLDQPNTAVLQTCRVQSSLVVTNLL